MKIRAINLNIHKSCAENSTDVDKLDKRSPYIWTHYLEHVKWNELKNKYEVVSHTSMTLYLANDAARGL